MMTELMLDTCKYAQCLCWLPTDNVIPCVLTSILLFGKSQSARLRYKDIRDPFTIQFTHMPRGKRAHVAAAFHHIDA